MGIKFLVFLVYMLGLAVGSATFIRFYPITQVLRIVLLQPVRSHFINGRLLGFHASVRYSCSATP